MLERLPQSVQAATDALFAHNDFLNRFMEDCCVVEHGAKVKVIDMWHTYEMWCQDQGEDPAQGRTFNRMMEERGYERRQTRMRDGKNAKAWLGIRLMTAEELEGRGIDAASTENGANKVPDPSAIETTEAKEFVATVQLPHTRRHQARPTLIPKFTSYADRERWQRENFPTVFNGGVPK